MAVKFLGVSSTAVVGSSIVIAKPPVEDFLPGDCFFMFLAIQGYAGTSITPPSGWEVEPSPQTIGDQIVFSAIHYVDVPANEGATYTFAYTASKSMVGVIAAYRGVKQDVLYDVVNYPFGYYAPDGSLGTADKQTAVTSIVTPSSGSSAFVAYSRALLFFAGTHASAIPRLSDVSPLTAIRTKVEQAKVSAVLCDLLTPVSTSPIPSYLVLSNQTLSGAIGFVRVLEPIAAKNDSYDSYKAKILRHMLDPTPLDARYSTPLGKILTVIGGSDNYIGGLHGSEDFLPDEV